MDVTQTQNTEGQLANDSFIPPKDDLCFINDLPPELLSRVFEFGVGCLDNWADSEDEDKAVDSWDFLRYLDTIMVDEQDAYDNDVEAMDELGEEGGDQMETMADEIRLHDSCVEAMEDLEGDDEQGDEVDIDDEGYSDVTGSSDSLPPFQILVSYVCHHWRNVAFSTPSLWTTLGVSPRAGLSCAPGLTLLERSKDLPMDVCINGQLSRGEDDAAAPSEDELRSVLSMFIPHVHRWRTMIIGIPKYHLVYEFLSALADPFIPAASQLTTFELYYNTAVDEFGTFGYPSMSKHLTLFGGAAPLLTTIGLWGVHVDWSQPWIASATNLKDLALSLHAEDVRPSWAQFATILRGASALGKLTLHQSGPSGVPAEWFIEPTPGSPADINAPIQLPRVTDLTLAYHSQARAIGLLHKFYLPALKNLVLEFNDNDYTDFVHELARPATSLSRAQEQRRSLLSRLESLKIVGLPCDVECVKVLYGELQNVRTLDVSLWALRSLFLDVLGTPCTLAGRSGDVWLPRLATLYVSGTSTHALRDVVRKRRDAGVPLSSLYVETSCEVTHDDVKWLMENVAKLKFFDG